MRHGGMIVLAAVAGFSFGIAQAADTQTKTTEPAKPAVATAAAQTAKAPTQAPAAQPGTVLSAPQQQVTDSPLVRAAKASMAARNRDPKKRIVIDSTNLVIAPHSSPSSQTAAPADPGRSYQSGNQGDASAIAARERAARDSRDAQEKARQDSLRNEQSRMGAESQEPYGNPDVPEDQVPERLTNIPTEIKNPPL